MCFRAPCTWVHVTLVHPASTHTLYALSTAVYLGSRFPHVHDVLICTVYQDARCTIVHCARWYTICVSPSLTDEFPLSTFDHAVFGRKLVQRIANLLACHAVILQVRTKDYTAVAYGCAGDGHSSAWVRNEQRVYGCSKQMVFPLAAGFSPPASRRVYEESAGDKQQSWDSIVDRSSSCLVLLIFSFADSCIRTSFTPCLAMSVYRTSYMPFFHDGERGMLPGEGGAYRSHRNALLRVRVCVKPPCVVSLSVLEASLHLPVQV